MPHPIGTLHSVQALRGIAALMVLLAHVHLTPSKPPQLIFGTAIGVDLFFVISGFVVALAADRKRSTSTFFVERLTRVLPLYYLASILALLTLSGSGWSRNMLWNTFLLLPVFDVWDYTNPAHFFGWSIAIEIWLYSLVALALCISRRSWHVVFTVLLGLLLIVNYLAPERILVLHFIGTPLLLEFLMGVWLFKRGGTLKPSVALAVAVLGACLVIYNMQARPYLAHHGGPLAIFSMGMLRTIMWGIPCALVLAGCVSLERAGFGVPRVLSWFGGWSYSFYLMQPFSLVLVGLMGIGSWTGTALAFIALNCVASFAIYQAVERPLMAWRKQVGASVERDLRRQTRL